MYFTEMFLFLEDQGIIENTFWQMCKLPISYPLGAKYEIHLPESIFQTRSTAPSRKPHFLNV